MKRTRIDYKKIYDRNTVINAIYRYNRARKRYLRIPKLKIDHYADILIDLLKNQDKIDFSNYRKKIIGNKKGEKLRELLIPTKINLLLQSCFIEAFKKYIENKTPMCSYSSRKGMGAHKMFKVFYDFIHTYKDKKTSLYCLYFDISKYYNNIRHDVLKTRIKNNFKSENHEFENFCYKLIDSVPGNVGLPIGNAVSHIFANFYISKLLEEINQRPEILKTGVYMDNWNIISANKRKLHQFRRWLFEKLKTEYGLSINGDWQVYKITNKRGVKTGGFITYRDCHTEIYHDTFRKAKACKNECIKAIGLLKNNKPIDLDYLKSLAMSYLCRLGYFKAIHNLDWFTKDVDVVLLKQIVSGTVDKVLKT